MREDPLDFDGLPYDVIRRFLSGEADVFERRRVLEWAKLKPDRQRYLSTLRAQWERLEHRAEDEVAWAALSNRIQRHNALASPERDRTRDRHRERTPSPRPNVTFHGLRRGAVGALAAIAAVILVLVAPATLRRERPSPETPTIATLDRELSTGIGERRVFDLADGTRVTLAPMSRLIIPASYGDRSRDVRLEGQAQFVVVHDTLRPFSVHAGDARALDLGTAFVVRAYAGEPVRVVVTEGRVELRALSGAVSSATLDAGQLGTLARGAFTPMVRTVDPRAFTGWTRNELTFADEPLSDVVAELARWYDAQITLDDSSLARERFTATLHDASLNDVIETLSTVLRMRATRNGRTVVLHRRIP